MHDLITLDTVEPGALTIVEIDATMAYAEAEKAASTRVAYDADLKHFSIWCLSRAAAALPAHQGLVAAYISSLADSGLKASTIGRRVAAIAYHHKQAGVDPSPTATAGVRAVMKGIRTTDDVEHTKEGLLITIRRSKGDQEGAGQIVSLPHGHHIRPCEALERWLTAAGIAGSGQQVLFRSVKFGGALGGPLLGDGVARIVKS